MHGQQHQVKPWVLSINLLIYSLNELWQVILTSDSIINGLLSFLDAKFELLLVLSELISTVIIQESILKLSLGIKSFCFLIKALYINKFPELVTEMLNFHNKWVPLVRKLLYHTYLSIKHWGRIPQNKDTCQNLMQENFQSFSFFREGI